MARFNSSVSMCAARLAMLGLAVVCLLWVGACTGSNKGGDNSDGDSLVAKVDSAHIRDSLLWVGYHSNDLAFHGLHGHVKMMLKDGVAYEFDEDGVWTGIDGKDPMEEDVSFDATNNSYVRSKAGLIVREQNWEGYTVYTWADGVLSGATYYEGGIEQAEAGHGEQGYQSRFTYNYDSLGRLHSVRMQEKEDGVRGWSKPVTTVYKYLKSDAQGNWLICKSSDGMEYRAMAYWDMPSIKRDSSRFLPLNQTYVFTGTAGKKTFAALILGRQIGACCVEGNSYDVSLKNFDEHKGTLTLSLLSPKDGRMMGEWHGVVKRNSSSKAQKRQSWIYNGNIIMSNGRSLAFSMNEK